MTDLFLFQIDIPTLALTRACIQIFLAGLLLYLGKVSTNSSASQFWALGFLLNGISLVAFTINLPLGWLAFEHIVNHLGLAFSSVFILVGFWTFADQSKQKWILIALITIPIISLLSFFWLWPNTQLRILMTATSQLLFLFALQMALSRSPRQEFKAIYKRLRFMVIVYFVIVFWSYGSVAEVLPTNATEVIGYHRVFFSISSLLFMLSLAVSCLALEFASVAAKNADLSEIDWLTGCLNRRGFFKKLTQIEEQCAKSSQPYTIVTIDLDNFKAINDSHGHALGDAVLANFGKILRQLTSERQLVARLGGEEFCIVMPRAEQAEGVHLAEKIQQQCRQSPVVSIDKRIICTASFGVCEGEAHTEIESTLLNSDQLLYRAKIRGRNRIESDSGDATQTNN